MTALGALVVTGSVFAGGFEKATTWSGRYSGVGSAAVGHVTGAESLYFNPAGLAGGTSNGDVSLNFSPTWAQYEGASATGVGGAVTQLKSDRVMSPVFGAVASYKPMPKLGVGAGLFVAGGSAADYGEVDFTNLGNTEFKPTLKTKLSLSELSVGAAYEITDGLRFGASWRYSIVKATLCQPKVPNPPNNPSLALVGACLNDLNDKNSAGFRVGMQYDASSWGAGVNVRTPIKFKAEGKAAILLSQANGEGQPSAANGDGAVASISSEFPLQIEVGGFVDAATDMRLFLAYGYTKYSGNEKLTQVVASTSSDTFLNWKDQNHFRLGAEYNGMGMPIRVGYILVTGVTNAKNAAPTFSSPGTGHVMTLGSGYKFSEALALDLAGEYSFASGKGVAPATVGDYKSNGYVLHTGVTYNF